MNLNRLVYFAAVVDAGSFTGAARRLGITKAVVSQQVARLESELRTTLLMRTTRNVRPTEAGKLFYARCAIILNEAEDAARQISEAGVEPSGVLRIAAPNDYGARIVAPVAACFSTRYAACRIELMLSDAKVDLIAEQIDLSIRAGWLADTSMQARRIDDFSQWLVASTAFAERLDASTPDDVQSAPFIANGAFEDPLTWRFSRGSLERTVRMREAMRIDATPAILEATRHGAGLSVLPDFMVSEPIETGVLRRILPDWTLPPGGIHAVYPSARYRPAKVTKFVALLGDYVRDARRRRRLA